VIDFTGQRITRNSPARRIVALAPHLAENVYSAGAGSSLVGVVKHSDYPLGASLLPIVGGYNTINPERILALQPDIVLAWESGNSMASINILRDLGLSVYIDQTETLEGVAKTIIDIGTLAGTEEIARPVSKKYLSQLASKRAEYATSSKVTTFYQVWNSPLRTINGKHIISAAIELCGGTNIYADELAISPTIGIESMLKRNPQAIIASGMSDARPEWLDDWKHWHTLTAVQQDNLFHVNPDHIQRHTTRLVLAIEKVCAQLQSVRLKNAQ
jgi:iron complex transport system substrate-binding protein